MQSSISSSITEISINNSRWNEIVENTEGAYVYYFSEYMKAFQKINHFEPVMFLYEKGKERAINVFFKRDVAMDPHFRGVIKEGEFYDLISPYGYGGYIGKCINKNILMTSHHSFCKDKGYVSEVVKFHPLSEYVKTYVGEVTSPFHNVVRDLKMESKEIWMDFKSKVRKNVKRAGQYGLEIIIDTSGEYLNDFLKIYYGTMKRNNADEGFYFDRNFFYTLNALHDHVIYFHVKYMEKIIATELVLYDHENCYSYLGGTDHDFYEMRPNDYLKVEIIKWGQEKGLKYFILGGGHGADDGIFQYKSALAPHGIYDFYIGTDIFNQDRYNKLCEIRREQDLSFVEIDRKRPAYRF